MAGDAERIIGGIHQEKSGDADRLILKHSVMALGRADIGHTSAHPRQNTPKQ